MSPRTRGIVLLAAQLLLVSSIAGKYLYERATRPRVWVQVEQFDPNLPMRGRYLALSAMVDACSLPRDDESVTRWTDQNGRQKISNWHWQVRTLARNGKLVIEDARNSFPRSDTQTIWLNGDAPCSRARLSPIDFFIADTARNPFPLKNGTELWAEVTVPPVGPPRPIKLAINSNGTWIPLHLD